VLDTVSLALEAYDYMCHSRTEYYLLFVKLQRWWQQCQPYLTTVHICGMLWLFIMYYVSVLICVWNTDFYFYFMLGVQFHILQHH
jgi:hypothetical protein